MAARQRMSRGLLTIGLSALAFATGCADDGVSLHVICPIVPDVTENTCTWDSQSELCVADGVLNLSASTFYRLNLRVESGLKPRERDVPPVAEPNGMQMTRAWVELRSPTGDILDFGEDVIDGVRWPALANPITVATTGYVEPGGTVVVPITVIGAEYIARLGVSRFQQVVTAVKITAKTNGAKNIESAEFAWPIRLIKANLDDPDQCVPEIPYCVGSLGQDAFALACRASGN